MLFACLAVDGSAKKMYPSIAKVGERYKKFINEHLDIVELMFGGLDLQETLFPFKDAKGNVGITFADIVYEKFRCSLVHGNELPDGYDVSVQIAPGQQQFLVDIKNGSMTLPESAVYALGLICVLAPVNADQKIGNHLYHYRDPINSFVVDRWWEARLRKADNGLHFQNSREDGLLERPADFMMKVPKREFLGKFRLGQRRLRRWGLPAF